MWYCPFIPEFKYLQLVKWFFIKMDHCHSTGILLDSQNVIALPSGDLHYWLRLEYCRRTFPMRWHHLHATKDLANYLQEYWIFSGMMPSLQKCSPTVLQPKQVATVSTRRYFLTIKKNTNNVTLLKEHVTNCIC